MPTAVQNNNKKKHPNHSPARPPAARLLVADPGCNCNATACGHAHHAATTLTLKGDQCQTPGLALYVSACILVSRCQRASQRCDDSPLFCGVAGECFEHPPMRKRCELRSPVLMWFSELRRSARFGNKSRSGPPVNGERRTLSGKHTYSHERTNYH